MLLDNDYRYRAKRTDLINNDLRRTRKAIIALGCSYAAGQGAFDQETLDILEPKISEDTFSNYDYLFKGHSKKDLQNFAKATNTQFIEDPAGSESWSGSKSKYAVQTFEMETSNSFVNQMCEKLDNNYTPINFAHPGNGNMASINRLMSFPIDWDYCEDIIVVWCFTDPNRFDVFDDRRAFNKHVVQHDHQTLWPQFIDNYDSDQEKLINGEPWFQMQKNYTNTIWSENFVAMNFLQAGLTLKTWCKAHNARLAIFPAFSHYERDEVTNLLLNNALERDLGSRELISQKPRNLKIYEVKYAKQTVDTFPWNSVVNLNGAKTFFDLCYAQDSEYDPEVDLQELVAQKLITTDKWVFPCGHPSAKGHGFLAEKLIEHFLL